MQHTTTQPRMPAITQTHQTVFKKSIFVVALAVLGGITILAGIVSLISTIILFSNAALPSLSSTLLMDSVLDMSIGTLVIASSRALANGKMMAIWLCAGSILVDSLYSLMRGYELHYLLIGLGFLLIWQMLKFRQEWEVL